MPTAPATPPAPPTLAAVPAPETAGEALVDRACALHARAVAAREAGDFAPGESWARQALALMERGAGPDHPDVANVLLNLAGLSEDLGRYRGRSRPVTVDQADPGEHRTDAGAKKQHPARQVRSQPGVAVQPYDGE